MRTVCLLQLHDVLFTGISTNRTSRFLYRLACNKNNSIKQQPMRTGTKSADHADKPHESSQTTLHDSSANKKFSEKGLIIAWNRS